MGQAVSSHGTVISRAPNATPGVFTEIGEIGDLKPPSISRNSFDVSTQNDDIDSHVPGIMRRPEVTFPVNFRWDDPTHNHVTGLFKAIHDNSFDGYKVTFPDGTEWIFSGFVVNIDMDAPVDGPQRATITVRPSGMMWIEDVLYGDDSET